MYSLAGKSRGQFAEVKGAQEYKWHQDCVALTVLIASSCGVKAMKRVLRRAQYPGGGGLDSPDELLQALHGACHSDLKARTELTRELNARYGAMARKIGKLDIDGIDREIEGCSWSIPVLWGCLQHPNPEVRMLGRRLAHSVVYEAMKRPCRDLGGDVEAARIEELSRQNLKLRRRFADMQRSQTRLQARLDHMMGRERARRDAPRKTGQGDKREIKRLRRELAQQKKLANQHSNEAVVWRGLALAREEHTGGDVRPGTIRCGASPEHNGEACQTCPMDANCPRTRHCDLQGRKVAVIGGLDRLRPVYSKAIEQLGGECFFHTGKIRSGSKGLRNLVDKADLVVCITSINSHGAMHAVKKQCKKCRKPFCPFKGTSVGSLEALLRDVGGQFFADNVGQIKQLKSCQRRG